MRALRPAARARAGVEGKRTRPVSRLTRICDSFTAPHLVKNSRRASFVSDGGRPPTKIFAFRAFTSWPWPPRRDMAADGRVRARLGRGPREGLIGRARGRRSSAASLARLSRRNLSGGPEKKKKRFVGTHHGQITGLTACTHAQAGTRQPVLLASRESPTDRTHTANGRGGRRLTACTHQAGTRQPVLLASRESPTDRTHITHTRYARGRRRAVVRRGPHDRD